MGIVSSLSNMQTLASLTKPIQYATSASYRTCARIFYWKFSIFWSENLKKNYLSDLQCS